jgi:hypothetical protein
MAYNGQLVAYYSDQRDPAHGQKLSCVFLIYALHISNIARIAIRHPPTSLTGGPPSTMSPTRITTFARG